MKDVHSIDGPLNFKLPINHGKQTVKLQIDFCQQIMMAGEERGSRWNQKTRQTVLGQRGCSKRNPEKAPSWAEVSVQNPHSKEAPDSPRMEMKRGTHVRCPLRTEPELLRSLTQVCTVTCHEPVPLATVLPWISPFVFTDRRDIYGTAGMPFIRAATQQSSFLKTSALEKGRTGHVRVCRFRDCFQEEFLKFSTGRLCPEPLHNALPV